MTDTSREAVERLAVYAEGRGEIEEAVMLRALLARAEKAEADRDEHWQQIVDLYERLFEAPNPREMTVSDAAFHLGLMEDEVITMFCRGELNGRDAENVILIQMDDLMIRAKAFPANEKEGDE